MPWKVGPGMRAEELGTRELENCCLLTGFTSAFMIGFILCLEIDLETASFLSWAGEMAAGRVHRGNNPRNSKGKNEAGLHCHAVVNYLGGEPWKWQTLLVLFIILIHGVSG